MDIDRDEEWISGDESMSNLGSILASSISQKSTFQFLPSDQKQNACQGIFRLLRYRYRCIPGRNEYMASGLPALRWTLGTYCPRNLGSLAMSPFVEGQFNFHPAKETSKNLLKGRSKDHILEMRHIIQTGREQGQHIMWTPPQSKAFLKAFLNPTTISPSRISSSRTCGEAASILLEKHQLITDLNVYEFLHYG